jgi:tetratricopeptide (TPR) repeat protein
LKISGSIPVVKLRLAALLSLLALQEDTLDRARALAESGRVDDAIRLLEGRVRTDPLAPELALLAQLQAASGALPQSASTLRRVLELSPEQDGLRVTLGAILFELRRFDEAARELEAALARNGNSPRAHYYLAAVHRGLRRPDLAERSAERAIELSPPPVRAPLDARELAPSVAARHLLAEIRFEEGMEVESLLREVLAVEPDHPSARYLLARSLQGRGQAEEAAVELRRFDAIKRSELHLTQGVELSRVGRRDEAIAELELAVEAHPEYARAHYLLGRDLLRAGRPVEARAHLDRVVTLRPDAAHEVARLLDSFR